jgi:hypothetical protein
MQIIYTKPELNLTCQVPLRHKTFKTTKAVFLTVNWNVIRA